MTGAAGVYAGGRLGRAFMLRRLARLARGRLDLVRVGTLGEGYLAHVAGRVAAPPETLRGFLHGTPGVYRRMDFDKDDRLLGINFLAVSSQGIDLRGVPEAERIAAGLEQLRSRLGLVLVS